MAYMSQEGYDKLIAELKRLESIERPKASAAIAEARESTTSCCSPTRRLRSRTMTRRAIRSLMRYTIVNRKLNTI